MASHRKPNREESEVELSRVITPMLDMSFQILFFFVLMYQPSSLEGHMDMALPPAGEGVAQQKPTASSTDTTIDLPAELEVIVRTRDIEGSKQVEDGSIGKIVVKGVTGDEKSFNSLDQLKNHLETARKKLKNENDIKLQAEGRIKYNYVIEVMDVCRRAGFNNVAFAAPPDLARIIPGQ